MDSEVESILANYYKPEERAEYLQAIQELTEDHLLNDLGPEQRLAVLSKLSNKERLKDVPVEERTKELTPEEKKRLLKQLQQELGEAE